MHPRYQHSGRSAPEPRHRSSVAAPAVAPTYAVCPTCGATNGAPRLRDYGCWKRCEETTMIGDMTAAEIRAAEEDERASAAIADAEALDAIVAEATEKLTAPDDGPGLRRYTAATIRAAILADREQRGAEAETTQARMAALVRAGDDLYEALSCYTLEDPALKAWRDGVLLTPGDA